SQQVRRFHSREEWAKAAETQRRLVDLPGGRNSANVQDLARLYRRALQYEAALQWIEEWKKLSPGATQAWADRKSTRLNSSHALSFSPTRRSSDLANK